MYVCTSRCSILAVLLAIALLSGCSSERRGEMMSAPDSEADPGDGFAKTDFADDDFADAGFPDAEALAANETLEMAAAPAGNEPALAETTRVEPRILEPRIAEPRMLEPQLAEAPVTVERSTIDMDAEASIASVDLPGLAPAGSGPFDSLPAGASHDAENGYATIAVYYATDRERDAVPLAAYNISGNRDALVLLGGSGLIFLVLAGFNLLRRRTPVGLAFGAFGTIASLGATIVLLSGTANIEKHGVRYNGGRGPLVKGIAEVTVPDTHDRGVVERPSLLRFEVREDQRDHIVLTSAIELSGDDFHRRLAETVALSPDRDLLVFVHGFNVDFESAVRRTAQIAVDLPFEGVPVCYSWPSQATLFGYTIDENNAAWTQSHLKQFLLELAEQSGAQSINVVAHSMGNRPTTGAMVEIGWQQSAGNQADAAFEKTFDRVVLAAPDIDADRFRRDLAPALSRVANHVTLYASSDDKALVASKQVHGYPRAGESGESIVVVPGIETVDVSGIDLSLLGHSYYGNDLSMLHDLYQVVRDRLPARQRRQLSPRPLGELLYWQLVRPSGDRQRLTAQPGTTQPESVR